MLQRKSKEKLELQNHVEQYKNKYDNIKKKSESTQIVIEKVLAESRADLEVLDKLEKENVGLRKDIKKIMK